MLRGILQSVAALVVFAGPVAAYATPAQNGYFINLDTINLVQCEQPVVTSKEGIEHHTIAQGTGTIIGPNRVLTAAHVIEHAASCSYRGKPAKVVAVDLSKDVATLAVDLPGAPVMQYSCEEYKPGEEFFAIGFAYGEDKAINILEVSKNSMGQVQRATMTRSEEYDHETTPEVVAHGWSISGMSGGPVVDLEGHLRGIITAGDDDSVTLSRELSDTALCAGLTEPHQAAPEIKLVTPNLDLNLDLGLPH